MPDKTAMRVGSLILAGGRSIRMGKPKESLPFGEVTLLGHVCASLLGCTNPVVVVARDGHQNLPPLPAGARVTVDLEAEAGPLWAICAGLRFVRSHGLLDATDAVFVTACDTPFLHAGLITGLSQRLGDRQAVVPTVGGILQPLCAVYRVSVLDAVENLLARGIRTPRSLVDTVPTRLVDELELAQIDPGLRSVENLNTPEDYEKALRSRAP